MPRPTPVKTDYLAFFATADLNHRITRAAAATGASKSQLMRELIEAGLPAMERQARAS